MDQGRHNMRKIILITIGVIEILIGIVTLIGCFAVQTWGVYGVSGKPENVYIFVMATAGVSFILGIGILLGKEWARKLLMFFSGYIVITKLLIFSGLLSFTGQIMIVIPAGTKDLISLIYHALLVIILFQIRQKQKPAI